ncbi:DUF4421 domain-containing protein [Chitinophaga nivalis]|uniref:DUF4421 domain-containing protein n=1 Tax=Chitinophaga nivalis TaxID=2991709 RepID=A0ABT3IRJ7_9BACT|nr:DUF4421 domain-containing protein [Chitinophaga nivalis]MCW3463735.1 DUF4421 domain-containing protein [Chitinophaga nivalis]MCW3486575.1 DUF4421 domain-containing protein [Chitinophaga nivalis]
MRKWILIMTVMVWGSTCSLSAQSRLSKWLKTENDTAYIEDHTEDITARLYSSRKYTSYNIIDRKQSRNIMYRPNTPLNLGVGFNYKSLGLNLGFNFPFVNRHNEKYGNTKYIDLQTHIYLRKLVIDFYGQYYKGYYISNPTEVFGKAYVAENPFPQRPDIRNHGLGLNVQYIFNDKRFSYRAANLQDEYQKKSAGSFMVGGEVFFLKVQGDSSLIPSNMVDTTFLREQHYYRTGVSSIAANAGYAYTFVYKQHFFISLSASLGVGVNQTNLHMDDGRITRDGGWQVSSTVRASMGYNSSRYFAGVHYVGISNRSELPISNTYQVFGTGNIRVSLVRRFTLHKPLWKGSLF